MEKRQGGELVEQYVYGCGDKGKVLGDGLVEQLTDLSDTFYDLAIFRRKLSEAEEREHGLTYLGKIED